MKSPGMEEEMWRQGRGEVSISESLSLTFSFPPSSLSSSPVFPQTASPKRTTVEVLYL